MHSSESSAIEASNMKYLNCIFRNLFIIYCMLLVYHVFEKPVLSAAQEDDEALVLNYDYDEALRLIKEAYGANSTLSDVERALFISTISRLFPRSDFMKLVNLTAKPVLSAAQEDDEDLDLDEEEALVLALATVKKYGATLPVEEESFLTLYRSSLFSTSVYEKVLQRFLNQEIQLSRAS